jgi:hypothetical protein
MKERDNVLRILQETKRFIEEDKPFELKNLSNQTIHTATISQDPDNIIVAVLVYSMSKILERENYQTMEGWPDFYSKIMKNLSSAINSIDNGKDEECRTALGRIRNALNEISGDLGPYIKDIFMKAEINKAFKLYEHGLSTEKTAELLGISLWDLSSYIGQSTIHEAKIAVSMPISKRIKIAEEILK